MTVSFAGKLFERFRAAPGRQGWRILEAWRGPGA